MIAKKMWESRSVKNGRRRLALWLLSAGGILILVLLAGAIWATAPGAEEIASIARREDHPLWKGRLSGPALDRRLEAFADAFERRDDPVRLFGAFVDQIGVAQIIRYIEGENHACHGALHALGAVLVERTGDLKSAMMLCGNACTYACVHGAMTQYLATVLSQPDESALPGKGGGKEKEPLRRDLLSLCRDDSKVVPDFFPGNCAHAVGHGFADVTKGLSEARAQCAIFPDPERRYYCETGVYMELRPALERQIYQGESSRSRKPDGALRFCVEKSEWPSACLRFLLEPVRRPEQIDAVRRQCAALDGAARRGCFHALGYISRSYVASRPDEIDRVCGGGERVDQEGCIAGLVLTKKDHRLRETVARSCAFLINPSMKKICDDQRRRFYYQIDNPVMKTILLGVKRGGEKTGSGSSRD